MLLKKQNYLESFPALQELFKPAGHEVLEAMHLITVRAGASLFRDGEACENYLLILEGSARVQKLSESGQVIVLYHLVAGSACDLTTSCLLGGKCYPAEAVAETEVRVIAIPNARFQEALSQSPQFRNFVFSSLDKGIQELITLVEEVSFGHMDRRLARCLLVTARSRHRVQITHRTLAEELGTAREVVSRLLKEFERQGWVRLHRGWIEITDLENILALAGHTDG